MNSKLNTKIKPNQIPTFYHILVPGYPEVPNYIIGDPIDTGRKLNVHKTSRRRPGRLLNVLCTFNLRPVSTGVPAYPLTTIASGTTPSILIMTKAYSITF